VIERSGAGTLDAVYERFRAKEHMLPDGLHLHSQLIHNWIDSWLLTMASVAFN